MSFFHVHNPKWHSGFCPGKKLLNALCLNQAVISVCLTIMKVYVTASAGLGYIQVLLIYFMLVAKTLVIFFGHSTAVCLL